MKILYKLIEVYTQLEEAESNKNKKPSAAGKIFGAGVAGNLIAREPIGYKFMKSFGGHSGPSNKTIKKPSVMRSYHKRQKRSVRVWSKAMGIKDAPKAQGKGFVDIKPLKILGSSKMKLGAFYQGTKKHKGGRVSIFPGWEKAIPHEVGHAKVHATKLGRVSDSILRVRGKGIAGALVGGKMLKSKNEKVRKSAPLAVGAITSGATISEMRANRHIYKALRKRNIKPIRAAKMVAKRQALPLATYAMKPLAFAGATYGVGKYLASKEKKGKK